MTGGDGDGTGAERLVTGAVVEGAGSGVGEPTLIVSKGFVAAKMGVGLGGVGAAAGGATNGAAGGGGDGVGVERLETAVIVESAPTGEGADLGATAADT